MLPFLPLPTPTVDAPACPNNVVKRHDQPCDESAGPSLGMLRLIDPVPMSRSQRGIRRHVIDGEPCVFPWIAGGRLKAGARTEGAGEGLCTSGGSQAAQR